MMKEGGKEVKAQISKGYEMMLYIPISAEKLQLFLDLHNTALKEFQKDKDNISMMTGGDKDLNTPEAAALMVVANAFLNLDEVVMKN
jgi:hypothetical protein